MFGEGFRDYGYWAVEDVFPALRDGLFDSVFQKGGLGGLIAFMFAVVVVVIVIRHFWKSGE